MSIVIEREVHPDLDRLAMGVRTPDGFVKRWADDEPDVENIPLDLEFSRSIPGGAADLSCGLLRDMRYRARDLTNYNEVSVYGPGVEYVWRGYLSKSPDTRTQVSPAATGDVGRLKDDPSLQMIPVDRDPSRWTGPGNARRLALIAGNAPHQRDAEVIDDAVARALELNVEGNWVAPVIPRCEAWYDAGQGLTIGRIYSRWSSRLGLGWVLQRYFTPTDDATRGVEGSADIYTVASGTDDFSPVTPQQFVLFSLNWTGTPAGTAGFTHTLQLSNLAVYGTDVPQVDNPDGGPPGVLGPDVIRALLDKSSTGIGYTAESIAAEPFVIPHLVWREAITAEQGILDVNRFYRNLFAVRNKTLHWGPPETFGRLWHVRRDEGADPQSNGPDSEQEFNGAIVKYTDALTGTERMVGPPGSGLVGPTGLPTTTLVDDDPYLPLNQWNRRRWVVVQAGLTSEAGAIRLGELLLAGFKARQVSGSIDIGAWQVYDSTGARYPAWAPGEGDRLIVDDEPNAAERLIIETTYRHASRTASLTLDSPPDALEALLERLQVVLVGVVD